jgi:hypothetical protein
VAFARRVIFPTAGLDPAAAADYYSVVDLAERLGPAADEAARRYLDGDLDAEGAIRWLETYALYSRARAQQRLAFIDQYRSYVINYTVGKELVARWVESQGGTDANPARRWELFESLISSPRLPSALTPSVQLPTPDFQLPTAKFGSWSPASAGFGRVVNRFGSRPLEVGR